MIDWLKKSKEFLSDFCRLFVLSNMVYLLHIIFYFIYIA